MKNLNCILLTLTFLFMTACAEEKELTPKGKHGTINAKDFPHEAGTIYGVWSKDVHPGDESVLQMYFNRSGKMGMAMVCGKGKSEAVASAMTDAVITAEHFAYSKTLTAEAAKDGIGCGFSMMPGRSRYKVTGDVLVTSGEDGSGQTVYYRMATFVSHGAIAFAAEAAPAAKQWKCSACGYDGDLNMVCGNWMFDVRRSAAEKKAISDCSKVAVGCSLHQCL